MNATEAADLLLDLLSDHLPVIDAITAEACFEDENEWPIPDWEIEDREDEIARSFVKVTLAITDDNRVAAANEITRILAVAAEAGYPLTENTDGRWSDRLTGKSGITVNLVTTDF